MNEEVIKVKIFRVIGERADHQNTLGSSFYSKEDKSICVAVEDGYIHIKELQFPGKKRMESHALVNGMGWETDLRFL